MESVSVALLSTLDIKPQRSMLSLNETTTVRRIVCVRLLASLLLW